MINVLIRIIGTMRVFPFKKLFSFCLYILLSVSALQVFADAGSDFPKSPNPPRLVNDFAGLMTPAQQQNLESQLVSFAKETTNQITIVTVKSLGPYDVSEYATELGNRWGVGSKKNKNGIVVLVSSEDRKINISPGYGLEGALTDAMCGRIIRNEMAPEFKNGNYYNGFQKAATALIQATKGEYTAENTHNDEDGGGGIPVLIIVIIIILVIIFFSSRGGGGGGRYISRRGGADFFTGMILGNLLGGGRSGGGWGGGGGSSSGGGGGFGGFGGGSFGGGGASGSW